MGRSLGKPLDEPPGSFKHASSSADVHIFWKDGNLHHQVRQAGLEAEYPVAYSIGRGNVGKSYLVEIGGHLFQSPAAFYSAPGKWEASPGYEADKVLDFWRPIDSNCLFCHSGSRDQSAAKATLAPISCDRCHGAGEAHRQRPVRGTIINPARLSGRERDSICEQCHLEGATTVLNPGKRWSDYKPGQALEKVQVTYVYRDENKRIAPVAAVSHAEQLALSACLRKSGGKLWCGTCHNPHGPRIDRVKEVKAICEGCHAVTALSSTHGQNQADCVSCHMPKRGAVDVSHAAITDHRILKSPQGAAASERHEADVSLSAWIEPDPSVAKRDLGLALFYTARGGRPDKFPEAFRLLSDPGSEADSEIEAARGYMLLGSGQSRTAAVCFERALAAEPENAEYWLDLGVAEEAAGNNAGAEKDLQRSIGSGPMDYRPYKALAALYRKAGQNQKARDTVKSFLLVEPQSILMRLEH